MGSGGVLRVAEEGSPSQLPPCETTFVSGGLKYFGVPIQLNTRGTMLQIMSGEEEVISAGAF